MKKRILYLFVPLVLGASMLASCAPAEISPTAKPTTQEPTSTAKPPPSTTASAPGKPLYGGTLTALEGADPMGFDEAYTATMMATTLKTTNEELMSGDWSKGPAGTGQLDWFEGFGGRVSVEIPFLAESWEMPDSTTIVFRLRHGIRWALNTNSEASKLVAGRELNASDVAFSINRSWTSPTSFIFSSNQPQDRLVSVKALDKYTVECKVPAQVQGPDLFITGDQLKIIPPEVVSKYGDMKDWKNSVGTGPWILTDFVTGSSITYVRNQNYWMKDPLNPDNQLPYADSVKELIISDPSTRLAAFRTAKLDTAPNMLLDYDDVTSLTKSYPNTQYMKLSGGHPVIWGRMDKKLPFNDLRVRQALNMAVNKQAIVDSYYKGNATLFSPIYPNTASFADFNTPFDQMPQEVKDLFIYNPTKAKQLLADAGYPNGFSTSIACNSNDADFLSIVVADWQKVGVTLQLQPMEAGVFNSVMRGRGFEQMIYKESVSRGFPYKMNEVRTENLDDVSFFESDRTRAVYNEVSKYVGKDDAKWAKMIRDIYPFIIAQAPGVWLPNPDGYRVWQPWVKGYHGEFNVGYDNQYVYMQYVWVDQALKKSLGF